MSAILKQLNFNEPSIKQESNLTYLGWNNQVAQHFFNPNNSGKRIWFSVEKDIIEKIARKNNTKFSAFIEAIKTGPDWVTRDQQKVCIKARDTYQNWRNKNLEYPPYIAYLALFVLAVNHGESDDFSENNYYGRLRNILNENSSTGQYPSFEKMVELWDDLKKWSSEDKRGCLGEFYNDIYGKHFHVGIPLYQAVLTANDRKYLPKIFLKKSWDSDSNPTNAEILQALKENKNTLSNRTRKRIEKGEKSFLSVLVNRVSEELENYDEDLLEAEDIQENKTRGFIVLCMSPIDNLDTKAKFSFRCYRKAGLPDEDSFLQNDSFQWRVPHSHLSLSGPIENFNIKWDENFSAESGLLKFSYRGEKYKIFTSGEKFGISGWISGQRYTPNKLFYLAVQKKLSDKVQKWGKSECNKFQRMDVTGLPDSWDLFQIKGVNGDRLIKKDIPALSIDKKPRIKFEGGIRLSKGNKFFSFAPPNLSIIGGIETDFKLVYSIESKDEEYPLIQSNEDNRSFSLPTDIPVGKWISVLNKQTFSGDSNPSQIKFMLIENRLRQFSDYLNGSKLNCFGIFEKTNQEENNNIEKSYLKGAYGFKLENFESYPRLPQFSIDKQKIYFVGEKPGQIIRWPTEQLPDAWIPSWVVQFKTYKNAVAILWRNSDNKHKSKDTRNEYLPKEKMKLWKKIIWHNRKRIKTELKSKNKWIQFTKRAKNV